MPKSHILFADSQVVFFPPTYQYLAQLKASEIILMGHKT